MWPWEHAVVGYLAYSLTCRLLYRETPGGLETVVVVVAAVAPDLVDKPLAWEFDVFESGYALGHSLFVAIPLAVGVGLAARRVGRPRVGVAVGLGYLLHLPGDLLPYVATGRGAPIERLLWPVAIVEGENRSAGFVDRFLSMIGEFRAQAVAGDLAAHESAGLVLVAFTFVLWLSDGAPALREVLVATRRRLAATVG